MVSPPRWQAADATSASTGAETLAPPDRPGHHHRVPIDRQPAQCLSCGQLVVVDWRFELDVETGSVDRWPAGCPACGVVLTPPD